MPKPNKGPRLGGGPAHERLLLGNLAAQLFTHKRIQTTETKAKRVQPLAERLITFAKRGDIHARRRVLQVIGDKSVVHELFAEIAPLVAEREGGYTRIIKTGYRKGDNAPMALIELVLEPVAPKAASAKAAKSAAAAAAATPSTAEAKDAAATPAAPAADEDQVSDEAADEAEAAERELAAEDGAAADAMDADADGGVKDAGATAADATDAAK